MTDEFKGLSEEEYVQMQDAIVLITVLISGADGEIDDKEKSWAEKVTQIRGYTLPQGLREFYKEIGPTFEDKLTKAIQEYAGETTIRNEGISAELAKLNDVFPQIENREVAYALYDSFLSFARHVAKASGGFLAWGKIDASEKKLLGLDMITPVEEEEG